MEKLKKDLSYEMIIAIQFINFVARMLSVDLPLKPAVKLANGQYPASPFDPSRPASPF